ncbi:MAG: ABC transporter permease, partial [Rickettsiaceae bacterium]|nr:ABC transporter permease [Rickettsiaceae bacterium]
MTRIISLIIKELLALLRDPKGRFVLIGPPVLQLLIFSFAATLEVKNISMVVYNQDMGKHSCEVISRISASPSFKHIYFVNNANDVKDYIDKQKVIVALIIKSDFSRKVESRGGSSIQIIMDGRRSNASQIVSGYLSNIIMNYSESISSSQKLQMLQRNWFNQNLLYMWYTVPSLVAILAMIIALIITSLSVSRERELGTFDQILVSPLLPYEILIGKTIPAVFLGLIEGIFIWAIAVFVFGIPFQGSYIFMILFMFIFILSIVGVGLFISALSKTQQQSILGTFIFMVPAMSLSGYATPVENMPSWLQAITWFNPLKHALIITKGLFLKDMSLYELLSNSLPLIIIGAIT